MGKLLGIATRKKTRAIMDTHSSSEISFERGVGSDSRGTKRGNRQVTVVSKEAWLESCKLIDVDAPWTTRRANLFVEGIDLINTTGHVLTLGDVQLEITGELFPCNRMDEQYDGLTKVLNKDWRGGVTCKVISEGTIKLNDQISISK